MTENNRNINIRIPTGAECFGHRLDMDEGDNDRMKLLRLGIRGKPGMEEQISDG